MELLPNGAHHGGQAGEPHVTILPRQQYTISDPPATEETHASFDVGYFLRKYWLVLALFAVLGAAAGFASVIFGSAVYRTRLLLEVLNVNNDFVKGSFGGGSFEANEVDIQTQVNLLRSGTFLRRGAERMQSETVPLAPTGTDLFSRLRQKVHPATQDPVENAKRGLTTALTSFDARPVSKTRLIELTCESTSPDVAAGFLNSMAAEFVEDTSRSRMQTSQKTSEWLSAQIEETKSKVQDAEERLRDFIRSSGNVFAGESATLDDTKLAQLKQELSKIQAERIAKQTRYELTLKNAPETLGEILDDGELRAYQQQITALQKDKAALEITYTPKHEKVQRITAQLQLLETTYQNEIAAVVKRIKNDYEAALRHEKLLASAFAGQSQRVGSEAGKAAEYNALRREVETLRQMYQSLLMQGNQAGLSSSVPVSPIRIVEPSTAPEEPYRPRPVLNITFGSLLGLVVAGGFGFVRERLDRSIRHGTKTPRYFDVPELGVIPSVRLNGNAPTISGRARRLLPSGSGNGANIEPSAPLAVWDYDSGFVADSFRSTLASILRHQPSGLEHKVIMVTSPGPAEGKTTVVQNLGIALAETGRRVLLVDADFRRPHLHHRFDLPNDRSLIDLVSDHSPVSLDPAKTGLTTSVPGLFVLPNRPTREHVAKALYSPRLRAIFSMLRSQYDMLLVDVPPILHLADARIIAPLTDAMILVLRNGVTDREDAMQAHRRIQEDGLSLLGTVLTDCNFTASHKQRYYYDYADDVS